MTLTTQDYFWTLEKAGTKLIFYDIPFLFNLL